MRPIVPGLLVGASLFFAGWLTATLTVGSSSNSPVVQGASERGIDTRSLVAQLDRIEALVRAGPVMPEQGPTPAREPVKQGAHDIEQRLDALQAKLDELASSAALATAGLEELSRAKPEPDQKALLALHGQSTKDQEFVRRRVIGLDHRDVTAAYGTPTKKRSIEGAVGTPDGILGPPVIEWIWDMPSAGVVLDILFVQEKAAWASFKSRSYLSER
jgi:hypothetical protein